MFHSSAITEVLFFQSTKWY